MGIISLAVVILGLFIGVSEQCALPYWWNQQYHFQPFYGEVGIPKTTYRYRATIHRTDPNNYLHIQEYSEYTWWEHSSISDDKVSTNQILPADLHHMTNVVFGKDANTFNYDVPSNLGFSIKGKTNFNNRHSDTNNIVPQGESSEDSKTESTKMDFGRVTGFSSQVPNRINTNFNDLPSTKNFDLFPMGSTRNMMPSTSNINEITSSGTETTQKTNRATTRTTTTTRTTSAPNDDVERNESERERNEEEDAEIVKIGELMENEASNIIENDESKKDSASLKEAKETQKAKSTTNFFGGWFGKKNENETEPCKVSETDIYSLRSMIENMFSFPREHIVHPESKEKVREDILNKFRNFGLQVWTQNFTTPLMPGANGTEEKNEGVNLIGVIPGAQRGRLDDEIVLVGAHYDTVPESNGVDDNGSGLAVMLEVARAITEARCRLNHTLMFVAFDHEEYGAMGSNYFVDHYLIPEELKRARARFQGAFILDGILNYNDIPNTQELPEDYTETLPGFEYFINTTGNRGNFLAMISRNEMDNHLSKKLMNAWQDLGENKYKLFNLQVNMGNGIPEASVIEKHLNFLTSDHATFWYHNSTSHFPHSLNAVLLTDTGPFRGQMKKCYHSKCDDLTVISPEKLKFAKKTADALTATLVELTSATGAGDRVKLSGFLFLAHAIAVYFCSKMFFQI